MQYSCGCKNKNSEGGTGSGLKPTYNNNPPSNSSYDPNHAFWHPTSSQGRKKTAPRRLLTPLNAGKPGSPGFLHDKPAEGPSVINLFFSCPSKAIVFYFFSLC